MGRNLIRLGVLAAMMVLLAGTATADTIFTATSGSLSASATFSVVGTNLVITLANTSTADVTAPNQVLTALFFTIAGNPTLTPVSAIVPAGNTILFAPSGNCTSGPCNVGGEWAYAAGLSGSPLGAYAGGSSSGFGLFGSFNFNGPNLQGPNALDGLQYGITSAGDNPAVGNAAVTGQNALIKNVVVLTLSGLPQNFVLDGKITNVSFQYGTALTEPNVPGQCTNGGCNTPVPEPASLVFFGTGLLGLAGLVRRRIS